jgi:demethylmenaquinone methyltransferase/2-methoxy-6-polyprenyl-1,4-benzoquinol methylase
MPEQIIEVPIHPTKVQRLYNILSPFYDYLTYFEKRSMEKGLQVTEIRDGNRVLEVGFGTGQMMIKLATRVGKDGTMVGLDLSQRMLEKTRKRVKKHDLVSRINLQLGDARNLPYQDNIFDMVLTTYMLDLINTPDLTQVLTEFKRVLKPGGRVILVNMSRGEHWYSNMKLYEWFYRKAPSLFGGCRPIMISPFLEELNFQNINREVILSGGIIPSEVVCADKHR